MAIMEKLVNNDHGLEAHRAVGSERHLQQRGPKEVSTADFPSRNDRICTNVDVAQHQSGS
jgi:hypothetical protein